MTLQVYYTLEVRDRRGKLLRRIRRRSRSYVIAFLDCLNAACSQSNRSVTDIGGTSRTVGAAARFALNGAADDDTRGPVVGTGTTAVAITDSKLVTQIAQGTGAGQMDHVLTDVGAPSTSGSTRRFTVQRVFVNNSGASITIQECGIYGLEVATLYNFCVVRDIVSGGLAVPNGGSATLTYTIGVTA